MQNAESNSSVSTMRLQIWISFQMLSKFPLMRLLLSPHPEQRKNYELRNSILTGIASIIHSKQCGINEQWRTAEITLWEEREMRRRRRSEHKHTKYFEKCMSIEHELNKHKYTASDDVELLFDISSFASSTHSSPLSSVRLPVWKSR